MTARLKEIGPRRLLARVRDVMAGSGSAQERLDQIVEIIAADMVAEVCSVYLLRAGEVLELFATKGLKREAVHRTRLRVGEGLVGTIAAGSRPLALSDAQSHPNFAYRPETGEEIFASMMGVPILRAGRVVGVVAVQNQTHRNYTEEELETMQTLAMVLAEMVAAGELVPQAEVLPVDGIAILPLRLEGIRLNTGIGMGLAVLHQPRPVVHQLVAEDTDAELDRLRQAVKDMHGALDELLRTQLVTDGEHRDILETYRMIAEDAGWLTRIEEAIESGLTAGAAVQKVQNDTRLRMSQVSDPYLKERIQDLEDLANRLLQHLDGEPAALAGGDLPDEIILVARSLGPAELLDYDPKRLRGLILEEGSPTSHVAIVARAFDIPVLARVRGILERVDPFDPVIVDGENAQCFIRPGDDVVQAFQENITAREHRKQLYAAISDLPAETTDGTRISLKLNAGMLVDAQQLSELGADGIGLYRTEIPFMARSELLDVEAQTRLYSKILDQAGERPVVFRTLDVGGDKLLPYWTGAVHEDNPAMGWRAIRLTLDRPAVFRQQLRALVRAGAGRELRVMFPMIAEVREFNDARRLLDMELKRHVEAGGEPPARLLAGAMLEVPGLIFHLPALLRRVDFVSVGSNDLLQFLFAADRGNERLSDRYDALSPPALAALRHIVRMCRMAETPVTLCGEMGGRTLEAMALIGIGFRDISMSAPSIGPVKTMVRSLALGPLQHYVDSLLDMPDHSLREKLRAFAVDHGVVI